MKKSSGSWLSWMQDGRELVWELSAVVPTSLGLLVS